MPQLGYLLKKLRGRSCSRSAATYTSEAATNGDTRTGYPQTADGRHSSEATLFDPLYCPTYTCPTPTTETPQDCGHMAYNDDEVPHSQAEIQAQTLEAATAYVGALYAASFRPDPKALEVFSNYASQLEGDYDLGVQKCTNAMSPGTDKEVEIARSAAFTIWELEGCPTRDFALAYLASEYLRSKPKPAFEQRLRDVNAAYVSSSRLSYQRSRSTVR